MTLISAITSVAVLGYTRHEIYSIKIKTSLIYSKLDFAENRLNKLNTNEEKEGVLKKEIELLTNDYVKEFNKIEMLTPAINNSQYILIIELILASCVILIINL